MRIPQCTILEIPDTLRYDFDWVFLEIPVKNCIVGMLLTCQIKLCDTSCYDEIHAKHTHYFQPWLCNNSRAFWLLLPLRQLTTMFRSFLEGRKAPIVFQNSVGFIIRACSNSLTEISILHYWIIGQFDITRSTASSDSRCRQYFTQETVIGHSLTNRYIT